MNGNDMKTKNAGTKKKLQTVLIVAGMFLLLLIGCINSSEASSVTEESEAAPAETKDLETTQPEEEKPVQTKSEQMQDGIEQVQPEVTVAPKPETEEPVEKELQTAETTQSEDELGNPRSSYGLGSAAFLNGRNLLVSLFVTTPESGWTGQEQKEILQKIGVAVDYIEGQAKQYGVSTELIYDWSSQYDLKAEAETDFRISEDVDFVDRLDEEIALWFEEKISYEKLLEMYGAEGIATCVFVNNPGVSYAIVYDGTDNRKESLILFTGDYYNPGKAETAAAYAHEILHVFGAHDLYEDAEFTREVTDYVADTYPNEIMLTVSGSGTGKITQIISPVTAYHLGWVSYTEEVDRFPQLNRNGNR